MYRSLPQISSYRWLGILLAISATACTSQPTVSQSNLPQPSSSPNPTLPPSQKPIIQNDEDIYQQALNKADGAKTIGQSVASKDDLFLATQNLQDSVAMLKSISPTSSQYILATKVLPKYEQQLKIARQKAARFVRKSPQITVASSQIATISERDSFSMAIHQKLGGVPVIEVTLNDTKVPMLLDTGASHTLITQAIAQQLQLQASGDSQAKTANGTATFKVATIDRIKFGEGETNHVLVAIGRNDLPYGLLGHDVYDGYDLNIKENSIEFRKR